MSQFSSALCLAMDKMGWNQTDLASRTKDIARPSISRYLSGSQLPTRSTADQICKLFPDKIREDVAAAYATDHIPESAGALVAVTSIAEGADAEPRYVVGRPPQGSILHRDLEILGRHAMQDPNLAKALNFWAASLEGRPPNADYYGPDQDWNVKEDPLVIEAHKQAEDGDGTDEKKGRRREKGHEK